MRIREKESCSVEVLSQHLIQVAFIVFICNSAVQLAWELIYSNIIDFFEWSN